MKWDSQERPLEFRGGPLGLYRMFVHHMTQQWRCHQSQSYFQSSPSTRRGERTSGSSTSRRRWFRQRRRTRRPWCSCHTAGYSSHTEAPTVRLGLPAPRCHGGGHTDRDPLACTGPDNSDRFDEPLHTQGANQIKSNHAYFRQLGPYNQQDTIRYATIMRI